MGTAAYEDNARVLNETRSTVAGFSLRMVLVGPTKVATGVTCRFDASPPSGGTPPYSVEWYSVMTYPNQGFSPTSGTGLTFETHYYGYSSGYYYGYARVTDAAGAVFYPAPAFGDVTGYGGLFDESRCRRT